MSSIAPGSKVLVSGANGFIAVWVVRSLLESGYIVRGTVRAESKAAYLRTLFASYGEKFELVIVPDITKEGAFDAAVSGVDAIEHTASPFHLKSDDPEEIVGPAVKGTVGILESALKYAGPQLKRVVVLSSCAAVSSFLDIGLLNESNWQEDHVAEIHEKGKNASPPAKYRASKTLAERAAWEFYEKHKADLPWDIVTLCPPFVYGPVLQEVPDPADLNFSMKDFYFNVLKATNKPAVQEGSWVDVRDIALAHVKAIEVPAAGGNRIIVNGGNFIWQDWFDAVNKLSVPGFVAPTGMPGAGVEHKHKQSYDTTRARTILGMQFRDKETTTKDILESFKVKGW